MSGHDRVNVWNKFQLETGHQTVYKDMSPGSANHDIEQTYDTCFNQEVKSWNNLTEYEQRCEIIPEELGQNPDRILTQALSRGITSTWAPCFIQIYPVNHDKHLVKNQIIP